MVLSRMAGSCMRSFQLSATGGGAGPGDLGLLGLRSIGQPGTSVEHQGKHSDQLLFGDVVQGCLKVHWSSVATSQIIGRAPVGACRLSRN